MPEHSYRCACGRTTNVYFDLSQYPFPEALPCGCGGQLVRFFEHAPGMVPDIWIPHYDHQLGCVVTSRQQRDAVAKEKGFSAVGEKEYQRRHEETESPREEMAWDKEKFRECAVKAYNDLYYGNVEAPETPTMKDVDTPAVHTVE